MGEIKSVGFNLGKCTSNSSSNLGDSEGSSGIWYDPSEWTKRVYCKSTPLDSSSNTLGVNSSKSKGNGIYLKGSEAEISLGCSGTEQEEEASIILLKEASLTSLSRSSNGETISKSKWDMVCLEGAILGFWSRRVKYFNLLFLYSP